MRYTPLKGPCHTALSLHHLSLSVYLFLPLLSLLPLCLEVRKLLPDLLQQPDVQDGLSNLKP